MGGGRKYVCVCRKRGAGDKGGDSFVVAIAAVDVATDSSLVHFLL